MDGFDAFTLIELSVVVAMIAMLAVLLLPALAGARSDTWRVQCENNLKQLGIGLRLFEQDHSEMVPPAAYGVGPPAGSPTQLAWDTYIHHYIGGAASDREILDSVGVLDAELSPRIERCPADRGPNTLWAPDGIFGRRSYATVASPQNLQVPSTRSGIKYYLAPTSLGLGVYWQDANTPTGQPEWDAKSFNTSLVKEPGATLLLVEQACNQNFVGNVWPSLSLGPAGSSELYQINPNDRTGNQGQLVYPVHGYRFNYLFYDGHVQALTTNATIGSGTLSSPKGMWTIATGD